MIRPQLVSYNIPCNSHGFNDEGQSLTLRVDGNRVFLDFFGTEAGYGEEDGYTVECQIEITDPSTAPLFRLIANRLDEQSGKKVVKHG